jgi:hypothetical protein
VDEGIAAKKTHMPKTSASHEEESQKKPNHRHHAEIPRQGGARKMPAKGPVQLNLLEIAEEKFQPGVGGQAGFGKLDLKFSIDAAPQIGFSLSHSLWPFVEGIGCAYTLQITTAEGPFQFQMLQLFELFMEN